MAENPCFSPDKSGRGCKGKNNAAFTPQISLGHILRKFVIVQFFLFLTN